MCVFCFLVRKINPFEERNELIEQRKMDEENDSKCKAIYEKYSKHKQALHQSGVPEFSIVVCVCVCVCVCVFFCEKH